jgi:hypothetical protein
MMIRRWFVALAVALTVSSCASRLPPQASAQTRAIENTDKVAQVLLYIQDAAISLNTSKLLSDADTALVMRTFLTAGTAMKAVPHGAVAIAAAVLGQLADAQGLTENGKKLLGPYLRFAGLTFAGLGEVPK